MTKLPVVSGDDCVKALQRLGYQVSRIRGSHMWLACEGRPPVPVPRHKQLGPGILRNIIKIAEITVGEFLELLK